MQIDKDKCIGCKKCIPYCPVGAITATGKETAIELDECVECGNCFRFANCPKGAIYEQPLEWPRSLRKDLSNPTWSNPTTKGSGRGTAEMKTNELTGRIREGAAGICIEMGRPTTGVRMRDVQTVLMMLKKSGVPFHVEKLNPLHFVIKNEETGELKEEVLDEKLLSIIIEFAVASGQLLQILDVVKEAAKCIDTVFSVCCVTRCKDDGTLDNIEILEKNGYYVSPNAKVNVGLGRPKYVEE